MEHLKVLHDSAADDDRIISVTCGWSDEHLHTELMTSEGMNRTWSYQRSRSTPVLLAGMVAK